MAQSTGKITLYFDDEEVEAFAIKGSQKQILAEEYRDSDYHELLFKEGKENIAFYFRKEKHTFRVPTKIINFYKNNDFDGLKTLYDKQKSEQMILDIKNHEDLLNLIKSQQEKIDKLLNISNEIPKFEDNSDVMEFLKLYEITCKNYNWEKDEQKIFGLQAHLKKTPLKWYNAKIIDEDPYIWEDWKKDFIECFGGNSILEETQQTEIFLTSSSPVDTNENELFNEPEISINEMWSTSRGNDIIQNDSDVYTINSEPLLEIGVFNSNLQEAENISTSSDPVDVFPFTETSSTEQNCFPDISVVTMDAVELKDNSSLMVPSDEIQIDNDGGQDLEGLQSRNDGDIERGEEEKIKVEIKEEEESAYVSVAEDYTGSVPREESTDASVVEILGKTIPRFTTTISIPGSRLFAKSTDQAGENYSFEMQENKEALNINSKEYRFRNYITSPSIRRQERLTKPTKKLSLVARTCWKFYDKRSFERFKYGIKAKDFEKEFYFWNGDLQLTTPGNDTGQDFNTTRYHPSGFPDG